MRQLIFILSFLCVIPAFALTIAPKKPPQIVINVQGAQKQGLTLDGISANGVQGELFKKTLLNDLTRSGWFKITPNGGIRVTGNVSGSAGLQEALNVSWKGKQFKWERSATLENVKKHAHELSDTIVKYVAEEKGIATSKLAVVRRTDASHADLFICDYDGGNLKRITADNSSIVGPRWSGDGRHLFFTSYKKGFPAIYRADVKTGDVKRLGAFKGLNTGAVPSPVNPNKIALILSHQGNPELYVLDLSTQDIKRLTKTLMAAEASPAWSPDGTQICYVSDRSKTPQLYIVNVATGISRRLTTRGSENVNPDWNSRNEIVFATRRGAPYQIAVVDAEKGETSLRILTPKNDSYESPSWAPDGRHIVTSRKQGSQFSIWVVDGFVDGDKPYRVFSGSGSWVNPAWSR